MSDPNEEAQLVQITTPFGSRTLPLSHVNWKALGAMKVYYDSPEGQAVLDTIEEDEAHYVRIQKDMGISNPARISVGRSVSIRLLTGNVGPFTDEEIATLAAVEPEG